MEGAGIFTVKVAGEVGSKYSLRLLCRVEIWLVRVRSITGNIFHRREILYSVRVHLSPIVFL